MTYTAVAYYRTSSAANVGEDKDSLPRQRVAVLDYAAKQGIEIVNEYYDAAVKGTDHVDTRKGFTDMITYMKSNGARTILIENASRFARDIIVQETGYQFLKSLGFTLIAVDDPDAFTSATPTADMVRQILGVVSAFEKASLVAKLQGARMRKRAATGRCEGRKPAPEAARTLANKLRADGLTLRAIATELSANGFFSPSGKVYSTSSIQTMLTWKDIKMDTIESLRKIKRAKLDKNQILAAHILVSTRSFIQDQKNGIEKPLQEWTDEEIISFVRKSDGM